MLIKSIPEYKGKKDYTKKVSCTMCDDYGEVWDCSPYGDELVPCLKCKGRPKKHMVEN